MGKKLSEMSLEELWQLFPIVLTAHQDCWQEWYCEEAALLQNAIPGTKRIFQIGSTAIPAIHAKPIVDLLVELPPECDWIRCKEAIEACGYRVMSQSDRQISFNKGYTENGFAERVFHLHLRQNGDHDELYFRDYLTEHPAVAKEYEALKLGLWKKFEHNRDGYTNAKTEFVQRYTQEAKKQYGNRYED